MIDFNSYLSVIENINDGVYFVDKNRIITFWNKAAEEITGYSSDEVVGKSCFHNILDHVDQEFNHLCLFGCPLEKTIQDGVLREEIVYLHHKDGHRVKIDTKIVPIYENGKIEGAFEIFTDASDITEISRNLKELKKIALNDYLTGLPNRKYIETFLDSCMREYKVIGLEFAVIFFDIDNFRDFNNNYGHDVGDEALKVVTRSVLNVINKKDFLGRWGGEEFIAVIVGIDNEELKTISERIRRLVESSVLRHNGEHLTITISIGSTIVNPKDTIESVVKRADMLMYKSKAAGKNTVTIG